MQGFIKCDLPENFGMEVLGTDPLARVREVEVTEAVHTIDGDDFVPRVRHTALWAVNSSEHPTWVGR